MSAAYISVQDLGLLYSRHLGKLSYTSDSDNKHLLVLLSTESAPAP